MSATKQCLRCGEVYPASPEHFAVKRSRTDGLNSYCRSCWRTYCLSRKRSYGVEPRKTVQRHDGMKRCTQCLEWKPETADHFYALKGHLVARCKKCANESSRSYAQSHPDQVRTTSRLSQQKRPVETKREYQRKWQRDNPDKVRVNNLTRRARKNRLPDNFTEADWQYAIRYFNGTCAYCGNPPGLELTADHFIPVADPNCPGTIPTNIVPACKSCNSRKNDNAPIPWITNTFGEENGKKILAQINSYYNDYAVEAA
jgi:5-methylcytosine-specific restriction endonuclease McrA